MTFVVSGYYGFGNIGDEAVLAGILATFRRLHVDADLIVLSADPGRTAREHPGVQAVHRMKLDQVVRATRRADLVISGGGSLFQDVTSALSPHYYLSVLRLARFLGRKTMIYAQGVGPLKREGTRRAVARAMNRADLITVRDADSKRLLEDIGVTKPIHLSADPSFLIEPDVHEADRILNEHGLSAGEIIGVSLRPWSCARNWLSEAARGISLAADRLGATVVCIPMQAPQDEAVCRTVGNAAIIRSNNPRTIKGLIARCGLVVGMRLHSLIFAAGASTPFVPIVYDPKVASFADACFSGNLAGLGKGSSSWLDVSDLTAEGVRDAVTAAWESRGELVGCLASRLPEFTDLALESGRLAAGLLRA
ncbi:MAG: polysaccharide pyruvyl transferase CsaB [Armatimonadota bacterium]